MQGRDTAERVDEANGASATLEVAAGSAARSDEGAGPLLRAFDALPHPVCVYDAELKFRYMNQAARAFFPDGPPADERPLLEQALASRQTVTQEVARVPAGAARPGERCSLSYTPVLDAAGRVESVLSVVVVSPLEAEAGHFEAWVASHSYAITTATLAGVPLSWNAGAELLFGYDASEIVGKTFGVLITELDRTLIELPERVRGGLVEFEARLRRKDGGLIDVFVAASPMRDEQGEVTAMAILLRDISERKELQRRVQSLSQREAEARLAASVAHDAAVPIEVADEARVLAGVEDSLSPPTPRRIKTLPERPVVLVVDDSPEFRDSLMRLLEESELSVHTAKSGLHALQILENEHVDLVLTDQFMPGIDGVRLLELVRERWPSCQRVLFTGHATSELVLEAVNRGGAHKVLIKSMHPIAIRDQIEAAALSARRFSAIGSD